MNKEDILKEYKNYCKDKNVKADINNFVHDYILHYYNLGKINSNEIESKSNYVLNVLKGVN